MEYEIRIIDISIMEQISKQLDKKNIQWSDKEQDKHFQEPDELKFTT